MEYHRHRLGKLKWKVSALDFGAPRLPVLDLADQAFSSGTRDRQRGPESSPPIVRQKSFRI